MHERRILHVQHLRNGHSPLAFLLDSSRSVVFSTSVFNRVRTLSQGSGGYQTDHSSRCHLRSLGSGNPYLPNPEIAKADGLTYFRMGNLQERRRLTPLELNHYDRAYPGSRAKPPSRQQKDTRFRPAFSASPDAARGETANLHRSNNIGGRSGNRNGA